MHVIDSDRFVIPSEQTSTSAKNADGIVHYFRDHCIGARAICLFFLVIYCHILRAKRSFAYPRVHLTVENKQILMRDRHYLHEQILTNCICARDTQSQFADTSKRKDFNTRIIYMRV